MVMEKTKKGGSVYLLAGEEDFLKDEFINNAKNKFLDDSNKELNFSSFSAKDTKIEDILSVAKTSPFIGKKRIVVIKDLDRLSQKGRDSLLSFLKAGQDSTCLILESVNSPSANRFLSAVSRYATIIRAQTPQYGALDRWIRQRVSFFNKGINKEAIGLLKELTGGKLDSLSGELEKIVSFIENRPEITVEDVEKVVGRNLKEDVFILVDYINTKDISRAVLLCKRLLQQGKKTTEIIGLMGWNFRKLLLANRQDNLKTEEFRKKLKLLFTADRAIKTGSSKPEFILDVLISRLCTT